MNTSISLKKIQTWLGITAIIVVFGITDYYTGVELHFFAFYFIPVSIAAWRLGLIPSIITSVLSATVWFVADYYAGHEYTLQVFAIWNTIIRLCSFLIIGGTVSRIHDMLQKEKEISTRLQTTLNQIKVLEGILPICASCKKIRNTNGKWQQIEEYIIQHSQAEFTHGLCPQCGRKLLEEAGIAPEPAQPNS